MLEVASGWDEPFFFRVSRGMSQHHRAVSRYAYNPSVTGTETIWSRGGLYAFPSAASIMTVSSSNAADSTGGTGARSILVQGLNSSFEEIGEIIALNGQSPVSTINSYYRIQQIMVLTAGSAGANVGNISIGTGAVVGGVPANVYGYIVVGDNISQSSVYTVPAGWDAVVVDSFASAQGSGANQHTVLYASMRPQGGVFLKGCSVVLDGRSATVPNTIQSSLPTGTDFMNMIETNDTNAHVTCTTRLILIKTGYTVT